MAVGTGGVGLGDGEVPPAPPQAAGLRGIEARSITWVPEEALSGVDISWLVGLAVAGLVYLLMVRSLDVRGEGAATRASEREPHGVSEPGALRRCATARPRPCARTQRWIRRA